MKLQTNNRLAHYQVELNEVQEQTIMLQARLQPIQAELANLQSYLSCNNGDKYVRQQYKRKVMEFRSLCTKIRKNSVRINTLQRQIMCEASKIQRCR